MAILLWVSECQVRSTTAIKPAFWPDLHYRQGMRYWLIASPKPRFDTLHRQNLDIASPNTDAETLLLSRHRPVK